MNQVTAPLIAHHKLCDDDFAAAEDAARRDDWQACAPAFNKFRDELETHFSVEETTLFPAFERSTGMSGGPTQVMRMEHAQMRGLLEELAEAVVNRDADGFGGASETLLVIMQQHNLKEENILYPMCDRTLGQGAGALREDIESGLTAKAA
jgi:iron-sulfur cluster repair protein YtfE (RIC family)